MSNPRRSARLAAKVAPASLPIPSPSEQAPIVSIYLPPRPTEKDIGTVCAHTKVLLTITASAVSRADKLIANTELLEYMIFSPQLLINLHFRTVIRGKIDEFTRQMKAINIVHAPLSTAILILSHIIEYIETC